MDIKHELACWGPDFLVPKLKEPSNPLFMSTLPPRPPRKPTQEEALAYTWRLATQHYENFPVITTLLPRSLRPHVANVYAYCRWADDLSDEVTDPALSLQLLDWWEQELDACLAGQVQHPVFVALKSTIREYSIPAQPFRDLLQAFRQDQRQQRYRTFAELREYCRGSADPVGRLVLYLGRCFSVERAEWSDSICTGLQLANFWQDISRDLQIGRIYLPLQECDQFGVSERDLWQQRWTPAMAALIRFQVERTQRLLDCGPELARLLPWKLRLPILLFAEGGLRILQKIRQQKYNIFKRRPRLQKWDVPLLVAHASWKLTSRQRLRSPPWPAMHPDPTN